jgi:hypothetical protein
MDFLTRVTDDPYGVYELSMLWSLIVCRNVVMKHVLIATGEVHCYINKLCLSRREKCTVILFSSAVVAFSVIRQLRITGSLDFVCCSEYPGNRTLQKMDLFAS